MDDTLLLMPPAGDPNGLLADSPGGGRVPWMWRNVQVVESDGTDDGVRAVDPPRVTWNPGGAGSDWILKDRSGRWPAALVLRHRGVIDPMGMARAREVLAGMATGMDTSGGVVFFFDLGRWRLGNEILRCDYAGPAPEGRFDVARPERIAALAGITDTPLALATILATHGYEVVVVVTPEKERSGS